MTNPSETKDPDQYYVTAEIKASGDIDIIRIETAPTLGVAHSGAYGQVEFLRQVKQRRRPFGKLETKPLLRALAAWPRPVLEAISSMRYGTLKQETTGDMPRGLRPLDEDKDGIVEAINRCAMNEAGDDDRVLLARKNKSKDTMIGPCELVECDKHPGQHGLHRWTWDAPSDGDHRSAIECGDPDIVQSCPLCIEEEDEDDFE